MKCESVILMILTLIIFRPSAGERGQAPLNAPRQPRQPALQSRPGPQRSISGGTGGGVPRGRGGFARGGRGSGRGRGDRGPAPTASNLDAELGVCNSQA